MIKEYVISHQTLGMPYWYTFTCYADSNENAIKAFLKEEPIGIRTYKVVTVNAI